MSVVNTVTSDEKEHQIHDVLISLNITCRLDFITNGDVAVDLTDLCLIEFPCEMKGKPVTLRYWDNTHTLPQNNVWNQSCGCLTTWQCLLSIYRHFLSVCSLCALLRTSSIMICLCLIDHVCLTNWRSIVHPRRKCLWEMNETARTQSMCYEKHTALLCRHLMTLEWINKPWWPLATFLECTLHNMQHFVFCC